MVTFFVYDNAIDCANDMKESAPLTNLNITQLYGRFKIQFEVLFSDFSLIFISWLLMQGWKPQTAIFLTGKSAITLLNLKKKIIGFILIIQQHAFLI